ncbi:MAG: S41 family peptidase [Sediminibacterium sp.]|nr:S41 family peptidase [Sediminibacterium sp.]
MLQRYKLFPVLLLLTSLNPISGQITAFHTKFNKLIGTFNVLHVEPPFLNEKTSAEMMDLFIKDLDPSGSILLEKEVNYLKSKSTAILAIGETRTDTFITACHLVYKKALSRYDSLLKVIAGQKLNFAEKDTLFYVPSGTIIYSKNANQQKKRIEKQVKSRCFDKVLDQEDSKDFKEAEAVTKAQEYVATTLNRLRKKCTEYQKESYAHVESTFLNAVATRYDPHSNYFNEAKNSSFAQSLSANIASFGFTLSETDDGDFIVADLEPGGSAWKSNQMNENDQVTAVKIGSTTFYSQDSDLEELQFKIDNTSEHQITVFIKKQNGLTDKVELVKQKTDSEQNRVTGYVLTDNTLKTGYIALPAFYTNGEGDNLPGCANDVAKEILKLENDGIQGLIIDLRNNGGGSMQEAMNLAGIFIDEGPLFIYKETGRKPTLVKDINRGSIFKKPLILMVNEWSASASELLSNIVKDYHCGLIVGSRTFGKGTAQVVLPLDTSLLLTHKEKDASDFIKVTTGKFYRLNGGSHQATGVIPDIEWPSNPLFAMHTENKEAYYLKGDSISKKVTYTPLPAIPTEPLTKLSNERLSQSLRIKQMSHYMSLLYNFQLKPGQVVLKWENYKAFDQEMANTYRDFENKLKPNPLIVKCMINTFDKELSEVSEYTKEFNQRVKEAVEEDPFIEETFFIMRDYIKTINNK